MSLNGDEIGNDDHIFKNKTEVTKRTDHEEELTNENCEQNGIDKPSTDPSDQQSSSNTDEKLSDQNSNSDVNNEASQQHKGNAVDSLTEVSNTEIANDSPSAKENSDRAFEGSNKLSGSSENTTNLLNSEAENLQQQSNKTDHDDADDKKLLSSSTAEDKTRDEERERSSSPEIIHIRTVPGPKLVRKSEDDLKKLFEIEYLEKVLFKIHDLIKKSSESTVGKENDCTLPLDGDKKSDASKVADMSKIKEVKDGTATTSNQNETEVVAEPQAKKARLSPPEDSDDEITTLMSIATPAIPGFTPALEARFCDLWDLSNQRQVAQFMYEKSCYEPLKEIIMKSSACLREIGIGVMANLCCVAEICDLVYCDSSLCNRLLELFDTEGTNPDVHCQILKLLSYCAQHENQNWTKFIIEKDIIPKSFKILQVGNKYTTEKLVENLTYIFDSSEEVLVSVKDKMPIMEVLCKIIDNYGVPSKEETSIETLFCLSNVCTQIESFCETRELFYSNSELFLQSAQNLLETMEEKQFAFHYKQVISRILMLCARIFSPLSISHRLQCFVKFSKLLTGIVEFLDTFEQEVESPGVEVDDFSMQCSYEVLTECYAIYNLIEKVKEEVGEDAFFESFSEEVGQVLRGAFDTFSSKNEDLGEERTNSDGNEGDSESDTDIVEISLPTKAVHVVPSTTSASECATENQTESTVATVDIMDNGSDGTVQQSSEKEQASCELNGDVKTTEAAKPTHEVVHSDKTVSDAAQHQEETICNKQQSQASSEIACLDNSTDDLDVAAKQNTNSNTEKMDFDFDNEEIPNLSDTDL